PMEDCEEPEIEIDDSTRKKKKTYPNGTILRFLNNKPEQKQIIFLNQTETSFLFHSYAVN
ncbi:MAG: hypothetical protein WBA70_09545, partial [Thermodesulfobacteriota bacterium]